MAYSRMVVVTVAAMCVFGAFDLAVSGASMSHLGNVPKAPLDLGEIDCTGGDCYPNPADCGTAVLTTTRIWGYCKLTWKRCAGQSEVCFTIENGSGTCDRVQLCCDTGDENCAGPFNGCETVDRDDTSCTKQDDNCLSVRLKDIDGTGNSICET